MDADTLFRRFFLPLYPEGARSDLAAVRTVDANPAKNPAIYAHLGDAASRFAVLFPKLVGEGAAALGELDFTDASFAGADLAGALKQLLVKTHETGGRESAARGEAGARRQAAGAWVKPGPP